jgi:23S rRNA (cytidine1920-2'-O)/16S rRNA (cytidine1409-2'-O)-methyltransferase
MSKPSQNIFASRAGLKLAAALESFRISPDHLVVADLGSSTGGFVDVLLAGGARKVYAIEKGFGTIDWRLRNDPHVVVLERTDARNVNLPELMDLITIDIGFTRQNEIVPHALTMIKPGGCIVSLLKPQYEVSGRELMKGQLTDEVVESVVSRVTANLKSQGVHIVECVPSKVLGKDARMQEFFLLIRG